MRSAGGRELLPIAGGAELRLARRDVERRCGPVPGVHPDPLAPLPDSVHAALRRAGDRERPLPADALYLTAQEFSRLANACPTHQTAQFHEPESATVLDFQVDGPRDFGAERASGVNVYEAVVHHLKTLQRDGNKIILASYSVGARERLSSLLADHGLKGAVKVDTWQEAQGAAAKAVALLVLQLDHGFTAPDIALLTEQDMLGDRLVRRRKKRKGAAAFLSELATLSPGDLVVHADHGIGRYAGLTADQHH